jgi:hypothetical protein
MLHVSLVLIVDVSSEKYFTNRPRIRQNFTFSKEEAAKEVFYGAVSNFAQVATAAQKLETIGYA